MKSKLITIYIVLVLIFISMFCFTALNAQTILFAEDFESSTVTSIVNINTGSLPNGSSTCTEAARGVADDFNSDLYGITADFRGEQNSTYFLGQNPLVDCGGASENMFLTTGSLDFSGAFNYITFKCNYFQTAIFGGGATPALEVTFNNRTTSQTYSIETFSTFNNWTAIEITLPNEMIHSSVSMDIYMSPVDGSAIDNIQIIGNNGVTTGFNSDKNNAASDHKLNVFPNPAINNLTYKLLSEGYSHFSIIDMNGRILFSEHLKNGDNNIDVSGLSKGTYILKVYGTKMPSIKELFIKN